MAQNQNVPMGAANNLKKVNIHQLTEKFKSKNELYNFLTLDCKAYLPKLRSTNVYFYKQIIKGEKKVSAIGCSMIFIVHQQRTCEGLITTSH
jgi:hypothetical protein